MRTYGKKTVELCFGGQWFTRDFVTADISIPLLGSDFSVCRQAARGCQEWLLGGCINLLFVQVSVTRGHTQSLQLTL